MAGLLTYITPFIQKGEYRMKLLRWFAPLFLLLAGTAAAQDVTYNFDKGTDFKKFKTYKWVEIKDATYPDQMVDKQIKTAIDSQLVLKGLTKTEDDKADLYIGYQIAVTQEKQINSYSTGGYGYGYGARWGGGMGTTTATTSTIHIGQLIIDMYDPAQKQAVWRGIGVKEIDTKAKPDKKTKNLNTGVAKILKNYPPVEKK
jgi:hypothetical protein